MKVCPSCGYVAKSDDCDFCIKCGAVYPDQKSNSQGSIPLPSDPIERGFALLNNDMFADAMLSWASAIKDGTDVPKDLYDRMLSESVGCMLRIPMSYPEYRRADLPNLSASLEEHELLTDMMAMTMANKSVCNIQAGLMGLVNEYMFMMVDCFNVYTDLADLKEICDTARRDLADVQSIAQNLPAPDGQGRDWAERWIGHHIVFVDLVGDAISRIMDSVGDEGVERLGDYWSSKGTLPYVNNILQALNMNSQLMSTGKLTSKIMVKSRDMMIDAFVKTYSGAPIDR